MPAPAPKPPPTPPASVAAWRLALGCAVCAGCFVVLVATRMFYGHAHHRAEQVLQPAELIAARQQLTLTPADEALKQRIRETDHRLRQQYFRYLDSNTLGAWLLGIGTVATLWAARRAAALRRRLPHPPAAGGESEDPWRSVAQSRRAVIGVGVVAAAALVGVGWLARGRVPGSLVEYQRAQAAQGAPDAGPTREEWLAQWPRFRGPTGDGLARATNAPVRWDGASGKGILWKTPVPAPGHSSPVVWGDRVFLSGGTVEQREVMCFHAGTGELLWRKPVPPPPGGFPKPPEVPEDTGFAAGTPVTDGRRVYAMFATGEVAAFDFAGRLVWNKFYGLPQNMYGHATSLAFEQGLLIVQYDQADAEAGKSRLYALEGATGRVQWEQRRPVPSSWTTPLLVESGGRRQLIACGEPWLISYDPATGTELWRAECLGDDLTPSPVTAGDLVLVSSPNKHVVAVRMDGQGDVTRTHVAWKYEDTIPDIVSPVVVGGLVFLVSTPGDLVCLEAASGRRLWEKSLDLMINASPLCVGTNLYLVGTEGTTVVVAADREFREVARSVLTDAFHASLAVAGERLYLRGKETLYCLGEAPAKP